MKGKIKLEELDNEQLKKLDNYLDNEAIRSGIKKYKKATWIDLVKMVIAVIASVMALDFGNIILTADNKTGGILKSFYWYLLLAVIILVVYVGIGRISKTRRMFKEIANNNIYIDFIGVEQLFLRFNLKALENNYSNDPWCVVVYIENSKMREKEALWVKWICLDSDKKTLESVF